MTEQATHDVDGLLRKNAELLGEVKALKGRVTELEGERDAALGEAATAKETARQVAVEKPLEAQLGGAFVAPWRVVRPLLDEHFTFAFADDAGAWIKDKDGAAVAADELLQAVQAIPDLAAIIKPARGGGAQGSDFPRSPSREPAKPEKVASPFGLR